MRLPNNWFQAPPYSVPHPMTLIPGHPMTPGDGGPTRQEPAGKAPKAKVRVSNTAWIIRWSASTQTMPKPTQNGPGNAFPPRPNGNWPLVGGSKTQCSLGATIPNPMNNGWQIASREDSPPITRRRTDTRAPPPLVPFLRMDMDSTTWLETSVTRGGARQRLSRGIPWTHLEGA